MYEFVVGVFDRDGDGVLDEAEWSRSVRVTNPGFLFSDEELSAAWKEMRVLDKQPSRKFLTTC